MGDVISTSPMIDGVAVFPLQTIADDRGAVLHMLRADAPHFGGFGEVYFSRVRVGAIKAWKRHLRMVQNLAVPVGTVKLVMHDSRDDSATRGVTQEIVTGLERYALIRIPPQLWYGFTAVGTEDALIANCASLPHDPQEVERAAPESALVPYRW